VVIAVPYRDPEERSLNDRERKRRLRAEAAALALAERAGGSVSMTGGLQGLLAEAVARIRRDPRARDIDQAREIGRLVGVGLRLLETRDLALRLEALERTLAPRREG